MTAWSRPLGTAAKKICRGSRAGLAGMVRKAAGARQRLFKNSPARAEAKNRADIGLRTRRSRRYARK